MRVQRFLRVPWFPKGRQRMIRGSAFLVGWLTASLCVTSSVAVAQESNGGRESSEERGGAGGVVLGEPQVVGGDSTAADGTVETLPSLVRRKLPGSTFVSPPVVLASVIAGKAPESLQQLETMEAQQRVIAKVAAPCTVGVQIGMSQGCGVIITEDGYVLTAAHVAMRTNKDAVITLVDGRQVPARTLGLNREVDAGLIKIVSDTDNGKPWPHASLGTSKLLEAGTWCVAMGHPGGYDRDRGIVARVGRVLAVRPGAIVTDCALIGGDSGGPLFNLQGELVGIHSRIGNDVADNLHVPIDHYDASWDRLARAEAWGFLPGFRPVLGVTGSSNTQVAEIQLVAPDSPAAAAGIEPGDVIEQFGDVMVSDFASLKAAVGDTMPGERVRVRIKRGERVLRVFLEIGRDPAS